jgi:hypothetical protein
VPVGTGMNGFMSIDDLEIGLWLRSDSSAANIIDLSHRRRYFDTMPGSGESITGGYTIFFHDQHVTTLLNQTLHTFPGNPIWNGDVLVLKNINEDVVTHITRQDYDIVKELLSKFVTVSIRYVCLFSNYCRTEPSNLLNFQPHSDPFSFFDLHLICFIIK